MAITVYKCDTCLRFVDIPQNKAGVDTFGRCNITNGCKGHLHFDRDKPDHVVGQLTPDAEGLDNWVARRLLYNHEQTLESTSWKVVHNLGTQPSIQVHVYLTEEDFNNGVLTEITPDSTTVVDANTVTLTFSLARRGIAQCIARSTSDEDVEVAAIDTTAVYHQVTSTIPPTSQYLTIATKDTVYGGPPILNLNVQFISSTTFEDLLPAPLPLNFIAIPNGLAWSDASKVQVNGKVYTVWAAEIDVNVEENALMYFTDTHVNRDAFIMLADEPYTQYDKDERRIAPLSAVNNEVDANNIIYRDDNLFVNEAIYEDIFPKIRIIQN